MEKSEPRTQAAPQGRPRRSSRRLIGSRSFVRLAVALSVLLAAAMVASLYIHWRRVQEPSTAIFIIADPTWSGAKIIVTPVGDDSPARRIQVTLDERNQYKSPIYELPGRYEVKVMLHDHPQWERMVEIARFRGVQIDLPSFVEVIGDRSLDGDQVLISGPDVPVSGILGEGNNFRLVLPLYGGDYSLEVTREGKVVDHAEFTVIPHAARQIDLRKRG
jgi:hypothetical protein